MDYSANDPTQQRLLVAALLGAPGDADDEENVAPVPTTPGTPYTPLVTRDTAPPAAPPNLLAQALANSGGVTMPAAGLPTPSATHYAQGPGGPLLLNDNQDALTAGKAQAPPTPAAAAQGAQASPATAAQAAAGSADPYTQWTIQHHAEALAGYNQARAQAQAALNSGKPDIAEVYLKAAEGYRTEVEKASELYGATLKSPQTVTAGQWVYSPQQGKYIQPVPEENKTELAKEEDVPPGVDYHNLQKTSGKLEAIPGTDNAQLTLWRAVNADRAGRGQAPMALNDFLLEKTASAQGPGVILGKDGQPIDESLTGDAVYSAVPGTVARMAKGMVDGTVKIPNLTVRTDPTAKQAFLVAQQADSSLLDVNTVAARREIEAGYAKATPGSLGGQVNAGNTAADHLRDVVEAANDLKNVSGGGVPLVAHIANNLRNNITTEQSGRAGALEDGLLHYGQEISKFYAGAQTGEMERLRFLSALGNAKSPEEMAGVFRMEARQLGGKFVTLDEQVRGVMKGAADRYPVVRASSKQAAQGITAGLAALDPRGQEAAGVRSPTDVWPGVGPMAKTGTPNASPTGGAQPISVTSPDDARKLPKGTPIILPDGRHGVVP